MQFNDRHKPKAFVLIADPNVYGNIFEELESSGFETEGLLSEISNCSLIIIDGEALQLDIVNYLNKKGIEKPSLLILTEMQRYSIPQQAQRVFQDILVVQNQEMFESGKVISALEGLVSLRDVFESYLPGLIFYGNRKRNLSGPYAYAAGVR